jgi:hypothetical protein
MGRLGFPLLVAMAVSLHLGGVAFQKGGGMDAAALDRACGRECRSGGSAADGYAAVAEMSPLGQTAKS